MIQQGDCLELLRGMADNSVDAVVTDPPYGLAFMGKRWDYDVPVVEVWAECLRVLKPGGHLLAFAGTRTQHRMAVRIEDAGFEIRDMIAWVYGSGFPKSHDVSKAIDKAAGKEREVLGIRTYADGHIRRSSPDHLEPPIGTFKRRQDERLNTATDAAKRWAGWGTALKPALEPITMARKPLIGTVAQNVLQWGTGAINVDGCRIGTYADMNPNDFDDSKRTAPKFSGMYNNGKEGQYRSGTGEVPNGRWPANLIHDGSDEVTALFPQTPPSKATPRNNSGEFKSVAKGRDLPHVGYGHDDSGGSAARFFYSAKASRSERDAGTEGLPEVIGKRTMAGGADKRGRPTPVNRNHHPTVKPVTLMRHLVRLVTPPNGTVLDPFAGSGTTGVAALLEGFQFVGMEREPDYVEIGNRRMAWHARQQQGNTQPLPEWLAGEFEFE